MRNAARGMLRTMAVLLALTVVLIEHSPASLAQEDWRGPRTVWVEEAGHTIDGLFLDEWRAHRDLLGLPITEEFETPITIGRQPAELRIVQYFEHAALVYVPEAQEPEWRVQGLPLGTEALSRDASSLRALRLPSSGTCGDLSSDSCTRFPETGHTIKNDFKAYWEGHEGERLIGAPITESFTAADGRETQYFQHTVLVQEPDGRITPRPLGRDETKREMIDIEPMQKPEGIPVYDESLFVAPAEEMIVSEQAGGNVVEGGAAVGGTVIGPGPQQSAHKEIVVSISAQKLWAYEQGQLVTETLVSTGTGNVNETITPVGHYTVLVKYHTETMEGTIAGEYYKVDDVPWVMYFDNLGNALHGTYWHSNFGTPMSHGCVNLPLDVAEFLYGWAPEGTAVSIVP